MSMFVRPPVLREGALVAYVHVPDCVSGWDERPRPYWAHFAHTPGEDVIRVYTGGYFPECELKTSVTPFAYTGGECAHAFVRAVARWAVTEGQDFC